MKLRAATVVLGLTGFLSAAVLALGQETPPASQPVRPRIHQTETVFPEGAAPRMELSATEWDFGTKWSGEPAATEITISNTGDGPLKILNIRSSCGCTAARPKKRELLPGESDTMTVTYNTRKNKPNVSQTITLETNDPQQPRVAIRIKGKVKQVFEAKPRNRITFGQIEREAVATESIELRNNMEQKVYLKLRPVGQDVPFDVRLEPVEKGMVYKLSATTKPPLKLGANTVKGGIVLETGLEKFPTLVYPISVYIAPRVAVTPSRLYVAPQVTKSFKRIVRVTYRADKPVQVTGIKSSHPDLIKAELMPPPETTPPNIKTRFHKIEVILPVGADLPEGGGQLEIYTDDSVPEYQKLVVDIKLRPSRARALRPARQQPGVIQPATGQREKPTGQKPPEAVDEGKSGTGAPE